MNEIKPQKQKKSHNFTLRLILTIIFAIFVAMIVLNIIKARAITNSLANAGETPKPVTAIVINDSNWIPIIETSGIVRPNQGTMLSTQVAGKIKAINIQDGQMVKKGEVLVELDSSVEKATLQASEAQLPALRATYQRYAALLKRQAVSQTDFDSAKSAYEQIQATISSLRATIERMQIIAPFDGIAGIIQVNVGQYVAAATDVVRVEDKSTMKVDFAISQNHLSQLHIGQKITATADARSGQTFKAVLTAIEPAITSSSGLVNAQAVFQGANANELLGGMFVRLNISLPTETHRVVVPQVAVSYNMYGEIAYILTPLAADDPANKGDSTQGLYRANQITVKTLDRQGIYALLREGDVKPGDKIVTSGQQNLSNGTLVKVEDKTAVGTIAPTKETNL